MNRTQELKQLANHLGHGGKLGHYEIGKGFDTVEEAQKVSEEKEPTTPAGVSQVAIDLLMGVTGVRK